MDHFVDNFKCDCDIKVRVITIYLSIYIPPILTLRVIIKNTGELIAIGFKMGKSK